MHVLVRRASQYNTLNILTDTILLESICIVLRTITLTVCGVFDVMSEHVHKLSWEVCVSKQENNGILTFSDKSKLTITLIRLSCILLQNFFIIL